MRVIIVTNPAPIEIKALIKFKTDDYVIAVDKAVMALKEQKIPVNLAVGDFDSLLDKTYLDGLKTIVLDPKKDETDTIYAIKVADQMNPNVIILLGGLGGDRVEHTYANLKLFYQYPNLMIKDANSTITRLGVGKHTLDFNGYISFFGLEDSIISLNHFKYPLDHYHMSTQDSLGISNEMTKSPAIIDVHSGNIICFLTKKDI